MTNGELIERLKEYPNNLDVKIIDTNGGVTAIDIEEVIYDGYNGTFAIELWGEVVR